MNEWMEWMKMDSHEIKPKKSTILLEWLIKAYNLKETTIIYETNKWQMDRFVLNSW